MTSLQSSRPDQRQAYAGGASFAALENAVYDMNQTLDGFTDFDLKHGSVVDGTREATPLIGRARWTLCTNSFSTQDTGSTDTRQINETSGQSLRKIIPCLLLSMKNAQSFERGVAMIWYKMTTQDAQKAIWTEIAAQTGIKLPVVLAIREQLYAQACDIREHENSRYFPKAIDSFLGLRKGTAEKVLNTLEDEELLYDFHLLPWEIMQQADEDEVTACPDCNLSKYNKTSEEWSEYDLV